jgi:hypothetical protein
MGLGDTKHRFSPNYVTNCYLPSVRFPVLPTVMSDAGHFPVLLSHFCFFISADKVEVCNIGRVGKEKADLYHYNPFHFSLIQVQIHL